MVEVLKPQPAGLTRGVLLARLLAEPPRAAVLLLCAVILSLRREGAWTNPQFWAEDNLFFERAYAAGVHSVLEPISGYLSLVLRGIAWVAAALDPALAPWVFVAGAAAGTLYVCSRALSARCPLPHHAGLVALAIVLVPDAREVLLNLVNLQWVLGAGLILLLLSRDPERGGEWAHDLVAAVLLGLTGPFCVVLCPLFAWRAWSRRSRASLALAAIVVGCVLIQGFFLRSEPIAPMDTPGHDVHTGLFLPTVGRRIGGSILLGAFLAPTTTQAVGTAAGIAVLAGIGFLALRPGGWRNERIMLGFVFAAVLASALFRTRHTLDLYFIGHLRARYMFIPQLLAIWLLVITAAQTGRAARMATAVAIWAFLVNLPAYREPAYTDMHWDRYVPLIRAGEAVDVPTNMPGVDMHLPARAK